MNLRAAWSVLFEKKVSAVGNLIALMNAGRPVFTPRNYANLAREAYVMNVIAYAAIKEVAVGAASVGLLLFRRQGEDRREITNHPLLDLLKRPNPLQGGAAFFEAVYSYFEISGNGYIEGVGPDNRPPRELWTHRPDRIRPIPGDFGLPEGYEYQVNGQTSIWEVNPVTGESPILHLRNFHPLNDWFGLGAVEPGAMSVDTHNKSSRLNVGLLDNSARPAGALVYKDDKDGNPRELAEEERNRLLAAFEERSTGAHNAGRPLLLQGGLEYLQMALSPKDMDFLQGKNLAAREITLAYGVPPQILGIPGDNTFNNMREARQSMWENTILPLTGFTVDELNNWLTPMFGSDLTLEVDEDSIVALAPKREARWNSVKDAAFLTTNEKRRAVGFDDVEGGDEILVPLTVAPLSTVSAITSLDSGDKFIDLQGREQRQREWRIQNLLMSNFSKSAQRAFTLLLKRQARQSAEAFKADGVAGVEISLQGHARAVDRQLRAQYLTTMDAFGERILDAFKATAGGRETKDRESFFETSRDEWMNRFTGGKVVAISGETRESILRAIKEGQALEETVSQISERIIEKAGGVIAANRAITIAQTETHASAMAANDLAVDATGLELKRRWLAALDDATRESHVAADGQIRDKLTPFDVGGAKLLRPGDPSGPPEETINCRCITDYITPGSE